MLPSLWRRPELGRGLRVMAGAGFRPGLVSAVTPTYNRAEFLREAIESALAQTYTNLEIIVVDDGSTDHTREVCARYKDRVKYIQRENDGTRGNGARARAILESRGEWVALLDHDDRWLPTKIEQQVAAAGQGGRTGIVFTAARIIDATGRPTGEGFAPGPSGDVFHQFLAGLRYCASSALVRRSTIDFVRAKSPEGDFLPAMKYWNNDTDLWIRIARYYEVICLGEVLTEYRYHEGNDSADRPRLWATDMTMLAAKTAFLHADCRDCEQSLRAGLRDLKGRLAVAHFDGFIERTLRGEKALGSFAAALRADFSSFLAPRRCGAAVKYLTASMTRFVRSMTNGSANGKNSSNSQTTGKRL